MIQNTFFVQDEKNNQYYYRKIGDGIGHHMLKKSNGDEFSGIFGDGVKVNSCKKNGKEVPFQECVDAFSEYKDASILK